ncbi:hypothetical protein HHI36_007350 [Cryptolaemus montrouzieri]|uniref:Transposase Helix-turn-helix domain-containing protein n=1 Tax=Cryptolaemus montrouzieri TaxID=559131 RepID=A0ABD2MQ42_9CUCU
MDNAEFMEHFRVTREVAADIAQRLSISDYFHTQSGPNGKIDPQQHTHIFLWFAGHQTASFRDVADRFNFSISCLHRIMKRMIYFLSNLDPYKIKWPRTK